MSARSKGVWHRCIWCRNRFRPYSPADRFCCHAHYARARRVRPETRYCALAECGRRFLVGGSKLDGRRRPGRDQRYCRKRCAAVARERARTRPVAVPRLRAPRRAALAAAIDGEGWVSRRTWAVEIGNTDRAWLAALRRFAGCAGAIREDHAHRRRGWKRFWRWRVTGANAFALLGQVLSDLVVKRARADRFIRRYRAAHPRAVRL